jgi:hypothetical protein
MPESGGNMIKRLPYLIALLLAGLAVPLRASPPIGVVVQTWHYDPQTRIVTVRIANTSDKDITAFNLSVTEKYADGTVNSSEKMTDYLPLMATIQQFQAEGLSPQGNGTFPAKTSRDVTFPVAKDPKDVLIAVDMVAYADHTADVTNERAFTHLLSSRKELVLATQQANQVIKDALTTPNPKDAAVKELKRLADVARSGGRNLAEATLRSHMQSAQQAPDLGKLIKDGESRIAVYTSHTQVVKGGQQ